MRNFLSNIQPSTLKNEPANNANQANRMPFDEKTLQKLHEPHAEPDDTEIKLKGFP
jgi:hypothetical protein